MNDTNTKNFIKFESINIDRAKDIAARYTARKYGVSRIEVVLTNRCQLNCIYCKRHLTPDYPENNIPHPIMMKTLKEWFNHGCKFIHFTGGEVSLCPHIYEYIELACKKGAEVTISTNGVNTPAVYETLVKKGVNCFHISLDTYDKDVFDKQVGVKGSFEKVINTINLIAELRDREYYKTKLVLNVCITPETFINLVDILHFMLSLKPDDIKLIPIAQLKDEWTSYEKLYEDKIKPELLKMLIDKNGFNMLKSRINSLVKKSFRGYNNKKIVPPCYLSQDERTIDPEGNYYGCYINYREGADPIGNIRNDSFTIQAKKLRKNIHKLTQSEICQKYCADLTVLCNNYIDKQLDEVLYDKCYLPNNEDELFGCQNSKVHNIGKLFKAGYNIPRYIYINSSFLDNVFISSKLEEYARIKNSLNSYTFNEGMSQWIKGQEISPALKNICEDFINKSRAKTFVVRSSANCEDGKEKTFAGCFETVLNITSAEEMSEAVKNVYSSKYSYVISDPSSVTMGVILQEQIDADYSGVAFSINPITGANEILINYTEGACEKVVSGQEAEEIIISREGRINLNEKISNIFLERIRQNTIDIENLFNMPIDIEWAITKKKLYILQARKITTIIKKTKIKDKNIYIDSMDIEKLNKLDLGLIHDSHKKYMEKHFIIRKKSIKAGINFPEVGYLFYNKKNLTQEILNEIIPDALVYKVSVNNIIRTVAKTEMLNFLKKIEEEDNIARIQKITITTACGNVSLTSEGNIYVEYIPGGFGGFLFGELPYSNYLLDSRGNILHSNALTYNKIWKFNEKAKKFKETEYSDFTYHLSKSILLQLRQIVLKCKTFFPNTRVEWELEKDKVYLNDISFENNKIESSIFLEKKLSEGVVEGEIRIIDNLEDIKAILKNRSIVPESEFYKAQRSISLKEYLKKINIDEIKKYVFICKYAHPALSILIPYSAGFIFEKGGILSHLAIILRENKIPAFLKENAINIYKDCKYI